MPIDPKIHTRLSRAKHEPPITLDEWRAAADSAPGFTVTDQMKQQNPFTKEFVLRDSPGAGHWKSSSIDGPVWSEDALVWFMFAEGSIMFTQFSNLSDPDLVALAERLDAGLQHYRVGE